MWLGAQTHPTTGEVTIFVWTPPDRRRQTGPARSVADGLRLLRSGFAEAGLEAARPRCFRCRAEIPLPDADAIRADPDLPTGLAGGAEQEPDAPPLDLDAPRRRGVFALVHLEKRPAEAGEEALVVLPGTMLALLVPLDALWRVLELFELGLQDVPPPRCEVCRGRLPGERPRASRSERRAGGRARGRVRR